MSVELATAYISLVPSMKGAAGKISEQLSPAASSAGGIAGEGLGRSIVGSVAKFAAPIAAVLGIGALFKTGFDGLADDAANFAQLAAGIKSTGGAANTTLDGMTGLAQKIQDYSGQTGNSIMKSEQLLLTFTNIKNNGPDKIFDLATEASANMAAKMGGDASSQAVLLGKALNDPVKGITALTRVGVSFTDGQKAAIAAMVKTGDTAGAQKLILKELGTEFGGAAKAAGDSFPGQMQRVHRAFEDLGKSTLRGFLPMMQGSLDGVISVLLKLGYGADKMSAVVGGALTSVFTLFKTGQFTGGMRKALGLEEDSGVVGAILTIRGGVVGAFDSIKSAIGKVDLKSVWAGIKSAVAPLGAIFATLGPALAPMIPQIVSLATSFSPFQIVLKAIGPLLPQLVGMFGQLATVLSKTIVQALTMLVPMFVQLSALVSQTLGTVLSAVLPVAVTLLTMLGQTISQLLPILLPIITTVVQLAMTLVSQLVPIILQLVTSVLPPVIAIFGLLLPAIAPLITMIAALLIPIIQALLPVVTTVFQAVAGIITSVMQIVLGVIQVVTGIIAGNWGQVWNGILNIFGGVWNTIVSVLNGAMQIIGSVIASGLGLAWGIVSSVLGAIGGYFADTWNGIISGVGGFIGNFMGYINGLPGQIMGALSGAGSWLYNVGRDIINGLISGVSSMMGAIGNAILSLIPGPIVGVFKAALGINSPSRVFRDLGKHIPEGAALGITDGSGLISDSIKNMVKVPSIRTVRAGSANIARSSTQAQAVTTSNTPGVTIMGNVYGNPEDIVKEITVAGRRSLQLNSIRAIAAGV